MRTLALVSVLAPMLVAVAAVVGGRNGVRDVEACSFVLPKFDELVVRAEAIVLADAIEVGDEVVRAPTVVTFTPSPTFTPEPGVETTATPNIATQIVQGRVSPTPVPTYGPEAFGLDLRGIGATLDVIEVYHGSAASPLRLGEVERARVETYIRYLQSNPIAIAPCSPDLGVWRFEQGVRYLALIETDDYSGTHATHLSEVVGDVIPVGQDRHFYVNTGIYERYFSALSSDTTNLSEGYTRITEDIPLPMMLSAIDSIRSGEPPPVIKPPSTGSAGLRGSQ